MACLDTNQTLTAFGVELGGPSRANRTKGSEGGYGDRRFLPYSNEFYHPRKGEKPSSNDEGFSKNSLTMSYFHTGTRTIIGAEAFHCPVRDGKEWDHLAMVIRLNQSPPCAQHKEVNS